MGIYLEVMNNSEKSGLIHDSPFEQSKGKDLSLQEKPASYQLVGEVKAYQGNDG